MKSLFLILFLSVMFISCKDDNNLREITDDEKIFEYIGLKDKANVIEAQEKVWNTYGRPYRPSVQVVDGYIYIATWSGIYRKPAKSLNRNRRIRMRKNRQISINAARSKTASSMLNISCTGDSE